MSGKLVRVNDILSELERQVGPLERQAESQTFLKEKRGVKDLRSQYVFA